jgi:flavin-dependent dehydrogenase
MSFGIVLPQQSAAALGKTPEERLEKAMRRDPVLRTLTGGFRRISPVQTYAKYQLISRRTAGANWAAVGDAFGFVEPMLSPGMRVAFRSATLLTEEIARGRLPQALAVYSAKVTSLLRAWMELIEYFYSGRIFELRQTGLLMGNRYPALPFRKLEAFMSANIAGMASGFTTESSWSRRILRSVDRFLAGTAADPGCYAVS